MDDLIPHRPSSLSGQKEIIYTSMSKHYFCYRIHISQYIFQQGKVPLNPQILFDYFLLENIEREMIRDANHSLIRRSDEIWVFGPISNGVLAEIKLAKQLTKPVHYFKIDKFYKIHRIPEELAEMEEEVKDLRSLLFR